MKLLNTLSASALACLASASRVSRSASHDDATTECTVAGKLIATIPWDVPDTELLQMDAGSCDKDSADVVYSQDPSSLEVTVTIDISACGLDATQYSDPVTRKRRGGIYDAVAYIRLGRVGLDNVDYVWYEASFSTECGTLMTYDIEFNYGVLDEQTDGDGSIQGGDFQSYTWTVTEYEDNTFTNPAATPESQAGKMVYLGITSPDIDYSRFKFIVESCQFQNADVVQEVTLFDWTSATNTCDNPFVSLALAYDSATNMYQIAHRLFTFGTINVNSQYKLKCQIKVCNNDDASSTCNAVSQACFADSTDYKCTNYCTAANTASCDATGGAGGNEPVCTCNGAFSGTYCEV